MKRITIFLMMASLLGLAVTAYAGDYHTGGVDATGQPLLKCAQCHTMHRSQSHAYYPATSSTPTDYTAVGPQPALLKDKVNELCLSCHNRTTAGGPPDVFNSTPAGSALLREAGGLNVLTGASTRITNETGFAETGGHTLYSTATAPGGTWANSSEGLNCVDCHMPHGHVPTQWRNLWMSTSSADKFYNKALTYSNDATAPDKSKDIWEVGDAVYSQGDVWFNEPSQTASHYADWCQSCHTNFHGAAGGTEVGGQSGGFTFTSPVDWVRHPQADVNIGHQAGADYVSSLARYQSRTNKVKVMSDAAVAITDWNAGPADATPSCFSCHKAHGDKNPFGLVLLAGDGSALSEEGDATGLLTMVPPTGTTRVSAPTPLCQQCHIQGTE